MHRVRHACNLYNIYTHLEEPHVDLPNSTELKSAVEHS